MPVKLDRTETVKVGDPYTFVMTPDAAVEVGLVFSDWWATDEPGRLFRVTAVHPHAVETVYLGFQDAPGSLTVAQP